MSDSTGEGGPVRAHAIITGMVQGVCYRAETRSAAQRFRVTGWVRNLPDGSVELVAEGPPAGVERLLAWCRRGPAHARVDDVKVDWETPTGSFTGFGISR